MVRDRARFILTTWALRVSAPTFRVRCYRCDGNRVKVRVRVSIMVRVRVRVRVRGRAIAVGRVIVYDE